MAGGAGGRGDRHGAVGGAVAGGAGAYSIGVDANESYCLVLEEGRLHVYYSERGHRNDERAFVSESEACQALLDVLRDDDLLPEIHGPGK
jgi:hypothetical protein